MYATFTIVASDSTYIEILDSTRIHPETYEWARKMAVDALEYDEVSLAIFKPILLKMQYIAY